MQSQARQRPLGNSHSTCVYSSKVTVGAYSALWWMEGTPKATVTENQIKRKEWSYRLHLGRIWGGGRKERWSWIQGGKHYVHPQNKASQEKPLHKCLLTSFYNPIQANFLSTFLQLNLQLRISFFGEYRDSRTHMKTRFNLWIHNKNFKTEFRWIPLP